MNVTNIVLILWWQNLQEMKFKTICVLRYDVNELSRVMSLFDKNLSSTLKI